MNHTEMVVRRGARAAAVLEDLARLRLTIFEEFPYLYRGCLEDELRYLKQYAEAADSLVACLTDGGKVVGAVTGLPLSREGAELTEPFAGSVYPVDEIYYVGELLFYRSYRNRGLGLDLLGTLEDEVRSLGSYRYLTCATVERPEGHPLRPVGYLPIERFLNRTRFYPLPGIVTNFTWRETDGVSRDHRMNFWIKSLA